MTTTVYISIKTKAGHFDDMLKFVESDIYWTREFEGCQAVFGESSDEETNKIRFVELWDSKEAFNSYFEKRGERSGEKFALWVEENGISVEFLKPHDWGLGGDYKKS